MIPRIGIVTIDLDFDEAEPRVAPRTVLPWETRYIVRYSVVGFAGEFEAGPYATPDEAEEHRSDIAGFEGIYGTRIAILIQPSPPLDTARSET